MTLSLPTRQMTKSSRSKKSGAVAVQGVDARHAVAGGVPRHVIDDIGADERRRGVDEGIDALGVHGLPILAFLGRVGGGAGGEADVSGPAGGDRLARLVGGPLLPGRQVFRVVRPQRAPFRPGARLLRAVLVGSNADELHALVRCGLAAFIARARLPCRQVLGIEIARSYIFPRRSPCPRERRRRDWPFSD